MFFWYTKPIWKIRILDYQRMLLQKQINKKYLLLNSNFLSWTSICIENRKIYTYFRKNNFKIIKKIMNKIEQNSILIYEWNNGELKLEVHLENENIWLNQDSIAELFGVQRPAITKHLQNIFSDWELQENSVSSILELTANDWKEYKKIILNN